MANLVVPQILVDGARNHIVKIDVSLDGVVGDITIPLVVVDPSQLSSYGPGNAPPRRVRVDLIDWDVQDGLVLNLFWDSTLGQSGAASIWRLAGRSMEKAFHIGGLQNNANSPNGKITMTAKSTTPNTPLVATFKLHCVKQP